MQDLKHHAKMINDWAFFLREFKMRRINHHRIKTEVPLIDDKYDLCWDKDTRFTALISTKEILEAPVEIQVNVIYLFQLWLPECLWWCSYNVRWIVISLNYTPKSRLKSTVRMKYHLHFRRFEWKVLRSWGIMLWMCRLMFSNMMDLVLQLSYPSWKMPKVHMRMLWYFIRCQLIFHCIITLLVWRRASLSIHVQC